MGKAVDFGSDYTLVVNNCYKSRATKESVAAVYIDIISKKEIMLGEDLVVVLHGEELKFTVVEVKSKDFTNLIIKAELVSPLNQKYIIKSFDVRILVGSFVGISTNENKLKKIREGYNPERADDFLDYFMNDSK